MPPRDRDPGVPEEKLKSYDSKDYSEVIEFPVELVDRDGVVRRYSYEESLAVYQRRIQSAPWRYADEELIRAEVGHCSRRIDQIKRSHQERARTGQKTPGTNPRALLGEGYERVRAHYESTLRDRGLVVDGELPVLLSLLLDEPSCRTYHVGFGAGRSDHLLYVYAFDRSGDSDPRAAFDGARDRFRGLLPGPGVESMLLCEDVGDCGVLLTGASAVPEGLLAVARSTRERPERADGEVRSVVDWILEETGASVAGPPQDGDEDDARAPFERGLAALRAERVDEALNHLRRAVEINPWHRESYLALLAVLDSAELHAEAEMYGAMAVHYFGDDGLVRYRQGINLVRQGRLDEAVSSFDEAGNLDGSLYQSSYFAAHVLLMHGRDLNGAIERLDTAAKTAPAELQLARLGRTLRRVRALRVALWALGGVCVLGGSVGTAQGSLPALCVALFGLILLVSGRPVPSALARVILRRRITAPQDSPLR